MTSPFVAPYTHAPRLSHVVGSPILAGCCSLGAGHVTCPPLPSSMLTGNSAGLLGTGDEAEEDALELALREVAAQLEAYFACETYKELGAGGG